jgi:hypothetical protein
MLRACLTAFCVALILIAITQLMCEFASTANGEELTTATNSESGPTAALTQQQDFRVHSTVFLHNDKKPVYENLTLFSSGMVYDFLYAESETITIFDPQRGRLILLDEERKVRTAVSTADLMDLTARIKVAAGEENDSLVDPKFSNEFEESTHKLILDAERIRYEVKGEEASGERVVAYREFADWFTRLNAIKPGGAPPFARLNLNRSVAKHRIIPVEVERYHDGKPFARSKHLINWQLIGTDRERIDRAGRNMTEFKSVSFKEFWAGAQQE